jgi:hypothetical protein
MTAEIRQFRDGLVAAGVDSLRCTQNRGSGVGGDELVRWCARVDVDHPDTTISRKVTVTLVAIGRESVFDATGSRFPRDPWDRFAQLGDSLQLDQAFDTALEPARKVRKAN